MNNNKNDKSFWIGRPSNFASVKTLFSHREINRKRSVLEMTFSLRTKDAFQKDSIQFF